MLQMGSAVGRWFSTNSKRSWRTFKGPTATHEDDKTCSKTAQTILIGSLHQCKSSACYDFVTQVQHRYMASTLNTYATARKDPIYFVINFCNYSFCARFTRECFTPTVNYLARRKHRFSRSYVFLLVPVAGLGVCAALCAPQWQLPKFLVGQARLSFQRLSVIPRTNTLSPLSQINIPDLIAALTHAH